MSTHCRIGTAGNTWSTRCAARSVIRRPAQLGQNPRPLHENGTSRTSRQPARRNRAEAVATPPGSARRVPDDSSLQRQRLTERRRIPDRRNVDRESCPAAQNLRCTHLSRGTRPTYSAVSAGGNDACTYAISSGHESCRLANDLYGSLDRKLKFAVSKAVLKRDADGELPYPRRAGPRDTPERSRPAPATLAIHLLAHAPFAKRRDDFVRAETRAWGEQHGKRGRIPRFASASAFCRPSH